MTVLSGFLAILFGVVLLWLTPRIRPLFSRYRDWLYDRMPWMERIPGVKTLYSDTAQTAVLRIAALGFVAFGILLVFGVLKLK